MLNRYQTGPFVTVSFVVVMLLVFTVGLHDVIRRPGWHGWLIALTAILSLFNFHKLFYQGAD